VLGQGSEEFSRLLRAAVTLAVVVGMVGLVLNLPAVRPYVFGVVPVAFILAAVGRLDQLGLRNFDIEPSFLAAYLGCARSTSADSLSDQPLRVARPITVVIGLRRSGWQRSADHDRRSLCELGQNQVDPGKASSATLLGGPRRRLTGTAQVVAPAPPHRCLYARGSRGRARRRRGGEPELQLAWPPGQQHGRDAGEDERGHEQGVDGQPHEEQTPLRRPRCRSAGQLCLMPLLIRA
jgi:hypothetical protein